MLVAEASALSASTVVAHNLSGPNRSYDSAAYKTELEDTARRPGKVVRNDGDALSALASATSIVKADYYVPAHRTRVDGAAGRDGQRRRWAM